MIRRIYALAACCLVRAALAGDDAGAPPPFVEARASAPRVVSREGLEGLVRKALRARCLTKASVGVAVVSVATGDALLTMNGDEPLILASNTKILTANAALSLLGPDFAFRTEAFALGDVESDGTLQGDLLVRADGDPDPIDANGEAHLLDRLAELVRAAGIKRVNGRLVVDDTVFDREAVAPGWPRDQLSQDYCAPVAGFSQQENTLRVQVLPGGSPGEPARIELEPRGTVFRADVAIDTVGDRGVNLINVPAPVAVGRLSFRGKTSAGKKPEPFFVPIADPSRVAALLLEDRLRQLGIEVAGGVVLADAHTERTGRSLGEVRTPLAEVLRKVGKESSNVLAEHVYKRVGAAAEGQGNFDSGGRAVLAALERRGIEVGAARSVDGSGLSRGNRYAPMQVARLLAAMYREGGAARDVLVDMLPTAGVDGTLERRMTDAAYKGRVRAKTGYIAKVSALSGFAQTDSGEVLAFSVVMNGFSGGNSEVKSVQDEIARLLVDVRESKS